MTGGKGVRVPGHKKWIKRGSATPIARGSADPFLVVVAGLPYEPLCLHFGGDCMGGLERAIALLVSVLTTYQVALLGGVPD